MMIVLAFLMGCFASVRDHAFPLGGPGRVIALESATNLYQKDKPSCMFLPPNRNESIADSEGYPFADDKTSASFAVAFCTSPNVNAPGARIFESGTITGAHYVLYDNQVQISGTLDPIAAGLFLDGGGYYDLDNNVNSPPGGMCYGYDSMYNSVDPIDRRYCIKCCKGIDACNISQGELGCSVMVPGSYADGFDNTIATGSGPMGTTVSVDPPSQSTTLSQIPTSTVASSSNPLKPNLAKNLAVLTLMMSFFF